MGRGNTLKKRVLDKEYFVKRYDNQETLNKIVMIHKKLEKRKFPYVIPIEKQENQMIYQQWLNGFKGANYGLKRERTLTLYTLQKLHQTNRIINWDKYNQLQSYSLLEKWTDRLERFHAQKEQLIELMGEDYYIVKSYAEQVLPLIKEELPKKLTLCHGDVAHHNFMVKEDKIMVIDFDLAYLGDAQEELILWMHRVLPFMQYDLEALVREQPQLQQLEDKFPYLLYPNELMRESLFIARLPKENRSVYEIFYRRFKSNALANYERLQKQIVKLDSR